MRMIWASFALALSTLALVAGSAQAQVTRCGSEFGKWVCRTEQTRSGPSIYEQSQEAYRRSYDQQQQIQQDRETILRSREDARVAAEQSARQEDSDRREAAAVETARRKSDIEYLVAKAVREGRCADAKNIALEASDMSLADQAVRLCQP